MKPADRAGIGRLGRRRPRPLAAARDLAANRVAKRPIHADKLEPAPRQARVAFVFGPYARTLVGIELEINGVERHAAGAREPGVEAAGSFARAAHDDWSERGRRGPHAAGAGVARAQSKGNVRRLSMR